MVLLQHGHDKNKDECTIELGTHLEVGDLQIGTKIRVGTLGSDPEGARQIFF